MSEADSIKQQIKTAESMKEILEIVDKVLDVKNERIKELEEENRMQRKQIMSAYNRGWIPKQKIKDKMKKYEWSMKCYDSSIADYKQSQAVGRWSVLQELLQESEDK